MLIKDFEYFLTKACWDDPGFSKRIEENAEEALKEKGLTIPDGLKIRVKVQKDNTIYLAIPPRNTSSASQIETVTEEMDVWSSGNFFIWFAPLALKFNLFALRNSVPEMEV